MVASTSSNEQLLEASCILKADVDTRLCILSIRVGGVLNRPGAS